MELEFSGQIFAKNKCSNFKFHENPSSGRPVLHADARTEMTKPAASFRYFLDMPDNIRLESYQPTKPHEAHFILKI